MCDNLFYLEYKKNFNFNNAYENIDFFKRYILEQANDITKNSIFFLALNTEFQKIIKKLGCDYVVFYQGEYEDKLHKCTNLRHLDLFDEMVDISFLANMTKLQSLNLAKQPSFSDLTIETWRPLRHLTELLHLNLAGNYIDDTSFLESLTKLEWLNLSNCPDETFFTNLNPLQFLTNLKHLDLNTMCIEDLSPLRSLTKLEWLDLSGNYFGFIDDHDNGITSDLSPLSVLLNLKYLNLSRNYFGSVKTDLSPLSVLLNLKHLDLSQNYFKDTTLLMSLASLTSLQLLDLRSKKTIDATPLQIEKCKILV